MEGAEFEVGVMGMSQTLNPHARAFSPPPSVRVPPNRKGQGSRFPFHARFVCFRPLFPTNISCALEHL